MDLKKTIRKIIPARVILARGYRRYYGRKLNLKDPKLFTEKIAWLKLYDHDPAYCQMVDKIQMKKFVSDKLGGDDHVVPLLGQWGRFEDIDFDSLPNSFVLKANADSGSVFVVKDKNKYDFRKAKEKLTASLHTNYYWQSREWPYKNIKRKIFAEACLPDPEQALIDYKWFCFNGVPKVMYVGRDRGRHPTNDWYDMDGKRLNLWCADPMSDHPIDAVPLFDVMKSISEKLSAGIPFVRVDFYVVSGIAYVGELTFFHNGGFIKFHPEEWDEIFGKWLVLPKK